MFIFVKKKTQTDTKSLGKHEFHLEHCNLEYSVFLKDNWIYCVNSLTNICFYDSLEKGGALLLFLFAIIFILYYGRSLEGKII